MVIRFSLYPTTVEEVDTAHLPYGHPSRVTARRRAAMNPPTHRANVEPDSLPTCDFTYSILPGDLGKHERGPYDDCDVTAYCKVDCQEIERLLEPDPWRAEQDMLNRLNVL